MVELIKKTIVKVVDDEEVKFTNFYLRIGNKDVPIKLAIKDDKSGYSLLNAFAKYEKKA